VTLLDCSAEHVLQHIENIEVDLGVGVELTEVDEDENLTAELLYELPFCVVVPEEHRFADYKKVSWNDLIDEPLITLNGPFIDHVTLELNEDIANQIKNAPYKVNFMSTALEMTRQGFGLTLCLPYMPEVIDWVSANRLVLKPLSEPVKLRKFYIYQRSSRALSPASLKFKEFLQRYFDDYFNELTKMHLVSF
ncbi:MAG TPA: LysR family transcriptional regulator, partial [Psychrobacter sp.]|nr:LysR family transcriptional regulator [Psychrobacter sp.]